MVTYIQYLQLKIRMICYFLTARNRGDYYHFKIKRYLDDKLICEPEHIDRLILNIKNEIYRKEKHLHNLSLYNEHSLHPVRKHTLNRYKELSTETITFYTKFLQLLEYHEKFSSIELLQKIETITPLYLQKKWIYFTNRALLLLFEMVFFISIIIPITSYIAQRQVNYFIALLITSSCVMLLFPLYAIVDHSVRSVFFVSEVPARKNEMALPAQQRHPELRRPDVS